MKTKVYEIYEIEESYPYEKFDLGSGTLKEVHQEFCWWIDNHIDENYEDEDFYSNNPDVKLFVDSPEKWIEKFGDYKVEIYSDWRLKLICEV